MPTIPLTTDLTMLVYTAVLCILTPYIGVVGLSLQRGGFAWGIGNRDQPFAVPAWIERARRTHANLVENLLPFAILVLVAHVSGRADSTTATAATAFFIIRVAYTVIYVAGIPAVRTLVYGAGVLAEVVILSRILA